MLGYKYLQAKIQDVDNEQRTFWAVASSPKRDRHGDIVTTDGWKLDNFKKNPIVLWAHNSWDLPIARVERIKMEDGKMVFQPKFATADQYPFADTVFKLYTGGFLNSFSVGFKPLQAEPVDENSPDDGNRILEKELYEISGVPLPANPDATVKRALETELINDEEFDLYLANMELITAQYLEDEIRGKSNGKITNVSWDGSKSRFTTKQLLKAVPPSIARAARAQARREGIDEDNIPKNWLKLSHHEPDGTLNSHGVSQAKNELNQTNLPTGVSKEVILAHLDMHSGQLNRKNYDVEPCEIVSFPSFPAASKALQADVERYLSKQDLDEKALQEINNITNLLKETLEKLSHYSDSDTDKLKLKELNDRIEALSKPVLDMSGT